MFWMILLGLVCWGAGGFLTPAGLVTLTAAFLNKERRFWAYGGAACLAFLGLSLLAAALMITVDILSEVFA